MPELPEVEIYARYFAKHALGQPIRRVRIKDERILGDIRKEKFAAAFRGQAFRNVRRHGKHLFADAGPVWLHLHFGMTGDLAYYRDDEPRFARVIFDFGDGAHFAFEDMRLFGVAGVTADPTAFIAEHRLGPDPLDVSFTLAAFRTLLANRRGAIKSLLMSQEIVAGIGNLYADETLYQTSIHPRRAVHMLSSAEVRQIYTTMRRILRNVIEQKTRGRDYPIRYLIPNREEGERCPRCGGTIERTVVFGRTTYFCPHHQR
jgi:formamidopyrimidine-DNA glycosylase